MTTNIVDIDQVKPDVDPLENGVLNNPLKEDFTHAYAGREFTIPAEGSLSQSLPVIVHLAKHLAEKIVRAEFRRSINAIKDADKRQKASEKPIPDYKGKIWAKMKELVETDSDFFNDGVKEGENASNEEKFLR